jgi:hypothetical protein
MAMKSERSVMAAIRKRGEICAAGELVSGARLGHTLSPYLAPEAQEVGNGNMKKVPARCHGALPVTCVSYGNAGPQEFADVASMGYIIRYHLLGVRHRWDVHCRTPPDRRLALRRPCLSVTLV